MTAAAALAAGCYVGGGTAGSGHRGHGRAARLRSLGSGCGCREPGHEKGEAHGGGMAHGRGAGHRRAQSKRGPRGKNEQNKNKPPPPPPPLFFIGPRGSRRAQGSWRIKFLHCCEITATLFSN